MIPKRNNYWLLDSVAGWQIAQQTEIGMTTGAGDITLDPLPGNAVLVPATLEKGLQCPVAVAADTAGRVFVLDAATCRITILHLDKNHQWAQCLDAIGGKGSLLREFRNPRSVAVLPSGAIAVADTGNRRVQLFSAAPYALLHVWGAPEMDLRPCGVAADACGIIYILDRATRSVLRVRPTTGDWLDPIGIGVLKDPVALAVGPQQQVAVVDGRGTHAQIVLFLPNRPDPLTLSLTKSPLSVSFDSDGNLFAGTANALIAKLQPGDVPPEGWSLGGEGVSDYDGQITSVVWTAAYGLIAILTSTTPDSTGAIVAPRLLTMDPAGSFAHTGSFTTTALDSNIESCPWHRVQMKGNVPANASLRVESSTRDTTTATWTSFVPCGVLTGSNPDCLIQSVPGRFLQLRLTLYSDGTVSPRIHALKVFFPRESYLEYLPSVFQDDPQSRVFLDRFLSIFQTTFDSLDAKLDNLWQFFDPLSTPSAALPWLAAWIAFPLDQTQPVAQQRRLLSGAVASYQQRGTVAGLQQAVQNWTGVQNVRILEHFRLRNWTFLPVSGGLGQGARLWSHNFYGRLQVGVSSQIGSFRLTNEPQPESEPLDWGANQFSVLFPANPYTASANAASVSKIVEREKPVHTQATMCPIFPRLRVGIQATLGIDAYVGKVNKMILGKLATLSYDAVLAPSQTARQTQALGLSWYPRLGVDARVL
jgi:phage tail-like protein